jgi:DNA polymerase III subunit delta
MVSVKAQNIASFLASASKATGPILLYGPDAGLVSERAIRLAQRLAQSENPQGEVVRVDDGDLEQNPDHLSLELLTVPMFGGRKIVRAIAGRRINTALLKPLVDGPPLAGSLIVEAGDLKPTDGLRALFDKSAVGTAVPCYADEARDLSGMIAEVLEAAKLTISPEAQQQLMARLGADRALSRSEVDKLALYAAGKGTIDIDDVEAVVGDAAELAMDRVVNAAALGQAARALVECDRAFAAGENPQSLIAATQRHLTRLHRTRTAIDSGRSLDEVIRNMRPPLHFKQRQTFETQCRQWSAGRLDKALSCVAAAAKSARLNASLEAVLAEQLLIEVSALAKDANMARARG